MAVRNNDEMDLMQVSLNLLKRVGAHPHQHPRSMFIVIANNGIRFMFVVLMVWMMAENFTVNSIMDGIESLGAFLQGMMKLFPALFFRKNLRDLINGIQIFKRVQYKQLPNFKKWRNASSFYKYFVFSTFLSIIFASILNRSLAFACHIPDFPHATIILFFLQYFLLAFDAFIVIGTDLFFIGICLVIKRQFEKLEIEFTSLDEIRDGIALKAKFRDCINTHIFLLKDKTSDVVQGGFYIMTLLFQLAMYCFPAEEVTQAGNKVSMFIYNNKWYRYPIKTQKSIMDIICRAHRPILITAGSMLIINREAFTMIFKGSLSFYTLVKQMKEK